MVSAKEVQGSYIIAHFLVQVWEKIMEIMNLQKMGLVIQRTGLKIFVSVIPKESLTALVSYVLLPCQQLRLGAWSSPEGGNKHQSQESLIMYVHGI